MLSMETRSVDAIFFPAKKFFFSIFKIGCRFDIYPNNQSFTKQIFEIYSKIATL